MKFTAALIGILAAFSSAFWAVTASCSTYRGTFRPADLVCDLPFGRELAVTFGKPGAAEAAGTLETAAPALCRASRGEPWQITCALPSGRELAVSLSAHPPPRARCKLLLDCPAHY